MKFFQVMENSGKFGFSQGILERMRKVSEFQNFPKIVIVLSSEKYNFYKLQMVHGRKHYFHNNLVLERYFIN